MIAKSLFGIAALVLLGAPTSAANVAVPGPRTRSSPAIRTVRFVAAVIARLLTAQRLR